MDSHVLLHLLATHRRQFPDHLLSAVYVNHGLHPEAARWGDHCAAVCQALAIPFQSLTVDARPQAGESPEAAARRARYAALATLVAADTTLLTAHQQDDQAETLLLQLLRGAGPHGLAAMPVSVPFGHGQLLRPLLNCTRADLLAYAREHDLHWIEDSSNADPVLDRNYLRHSVLPRLRQRWPAVTATLARSARLCAETADLLDDLADADLRQVAGDSANSLHLPTLRMLPEPRQRNLLRRWFRHLQLPVPTETQLAQLLAQSITAAPDRQPLLYWPGCEVRRYRDRLYALPPLPPHSADRIYPITPEVPLTIPVIGQVCLCPRQGQGIRADWLAGQPLTIRFRQGGERFHPVSRQHRQELKKLLQEAGIPPWQRDRLPLLYVGDTLAAVATLGVATTFAAPADTQGWVMEFVP